LFAILPLLRKAQGFGLSCAISLTAALVLAVVAGFQPAYSRSAPQRLNLRYVEREGRAWWVADPVARLPDGLRTAAHFSTGVEHQPITGHVAPDGAARFSAPEAQVSRQGHDVTLQLNAPGDALALLLPRDAGLKSISIGGIEADAEGRVDIINCDTPDCGQMRITLHLSTTAPFQIMLRSVRHGLPPEGAAIVKARPPQATPSQGGDTTLLIRTIAVPAG
jgi:hypothetical protein